MRRKELELTDPGEIYNFLADQKWGLLSLNGEDGYPYSIPLNYLLWENRVYLHSAPVGRKLELLAVDPRIQFTVVKDYSLIPSYFPGSEMACSASQFFKSVLIRGQAVAVESLPEKIAVFQRLMEVFQPEGKYLPMLAEADNYRKMIAGTSLIMIQPEKVSAKFKFGQNLKDEAHQLIIKFLQDRGTPLDLETVKMMERYRP